jgi:hypothetical protein
LPKKDGVLNIGSLGAKIIPRTDEEDKIKEKLGPLGFKPLTFFESRDTKETAQCAASWPFTTMQGKKTNWQWWPSDKGDPTDVNDPGARAGALERPECSTGGRARSRKSERICQPIDYRLLFTGHGLGERR